MEVAQSNAAWLLDSGHSIQGTGDIDTKNVVGGSGGGAHNETVGVVCQKRRVGTLHNEKKKKRKEKQRGRYGGLVLLGIFVNGL